MPAPVGKTFSHYEVLGKLGAGGMGDVFLARDTSLGREVAVKFLPARFASDASRLARFGQEARAASSLNHPNIVTVHEVGEDEGLPYIVMERVEGATLRALLLGRPLSSRRALELSAQIAEGLAKAHAAGIVHRDLKPENVMVTGDGYVKILDFGLAKLLGTPVGAPDFPAADSDQPTETEASEETPETDPGAVMGTAGYMSPEQARGQRVDFRSDQFTLGSMLYEMLTGRRAFQRDTRGQTLAAILADEPPPLGELNPDCPPPLRWIVERCLAKSPDGRYASTLDLARELRGLREHISDVGSGADDYSGFRRRGAGRRRRLHAGGVVLAGLAALALAALLPPVRRRLESWTRPVPAERQIAVLPFASPGADPAGQAFSDGLVETLTSRLSQLEPLQGSLWVVPSTEVRQAGVTSAAAARRAFGVTLVITGSVQRAGDRVRLTANLVDALLLRQLRSVDLDARAPDLSSLQDGVVERVAEMLKLEIEPRARRLITAGGTDVAGAYRLYLEGRGHLQRYESAESLDQAVGDFQRALEQDPGYALAYAGLGEAHWRQYRLTKRPELVELAQKSCRRALERNDLLAQVHVTLGLIEAGTGRPEEAVASFRRALDLDPGNADAHRELAYAYETLGRFEEAEATFHKAIHLRPGYWAAHNHLGVFYVGRGRYPEAEVEFRKVIELTPDNVRGYSNLGGLYHLMGRDREAEPLLQEAIRIKPGYAAYSSLATIQFFQGRYAEAARTLEATVKLHERDYRVWRNLAAAYYWAPGERDRARPAYEHAASLAEAERAVNPHDAQLLVELADCYAMLGEGAKGRTLAAEALRRAPGDVTVMFYAGSLYEHLGDRKLALEWIRKALEKGYSREEVARSPGLAGLRADPRFSMPHGS